MEQKRLQSAFTWIPPEKRKGKFGPMPPRKPELRVPEYYLITTGEETFFVNNTDETLEEVVVSWGGFFTVDETQPATLTSAREQRYPDVAPGEAVLVNVYDIVYDSDFVLSIHLEVRSRKHGAMRFQVLAKGGFGEHILLWDNGDSRHRMSR